MQKFVPSGLTPRIAQVNGEPGVVSYREGRPFAVITLDTDGDRITRVYVVTNPEKLAHLESLPAPP